MEVDLKLSGFVACMEQSAIRGYILLNPVLHFVSYGLQVSKI